MLLSQCARLAQLKSLLRACHFLIHFLVFLGQRVKDDTPPTKGPNSDRGTVCVCVFVGGGGGGGSLRVGQGILLELAVYRLTRSINKRGERTNEANRSGRRWHKPYTIQPASLPGALHTRLTTNQRYIGYGNTNCSPFKFARIVRACTVIRVPRTGRKGKQEYINM